VSALRAGFELTGLELDSAGSARATRRLREALRSREDVELVDLAQPPSPPGLSGRLARGLLRELGWFPFALPRRARRLALDVLHCPMPLAPPRPSVPLVLTLNDVLAWEHPEWFGRPLVAQHRLLVAPAARRAARVLAPSHYSAERAAAVLGVARDRIDVVPYAPDPIFSPGPRRDDVLGALGVEGPYALAVGTLQPRKNLTSVLDAFERLVAEGAEHRLVVVGARGWRDETLAARLARSPAQRRVQALGRVSDTELVELYRAADCLVFCSRGEGFGFPVLEAMACGTPVACSSTTSLGEVAGNAAELADPDEVDDIRRALSAVLGSGSRRAELRRLGLERAGQFSWGRCAELTVNAYRRAVEASR
jgi:glycosyltransferase involved in cell wall biosynthesis